MRKILKILLKIIILIAALYVVFTLIAPGIIDKKYNPVRADAPYEVSESADKLYRSLDFIADMHCDALLWKRNLLEHNDFGQVDIPRMIEANIALQAFTIVTKSPKGQNFDKNTGETDNITTLSIAQGRNISTWFDLNERALDQCSKLHDFSNRSEGKFEIIRSKTDLLGYLDERMSNKNITAGFLGVEGAHALDGKIENVEKLFKAGVRMMAPTHFFDNKLGGSAHGISKEGLTNFGKEVILEMQHKNMIVDIAHSSSKMIDDILSITTKPVISSHTGVKGTCNSVRNLSDDHIRGVAKTGGLISIAMFETAVCGIDAEATAKAIKYVIDLVGPEYVALGSDFDGSVITPFDITGLPLIVEELIKLNITEDNIRKVMGGNVKRFMLENLPEN